MQDLYKVYATQNIFKGIDQPEYEKYLAKIRRFFPAGFFKFYHLLQNNQIEAITNSTIIKRKKLLEQYKAEEKIRQIETAKTFEKNKAAFKKELKNKLQVFVREDVIPSFKDVGTYAKLLFYDEFGKMLKNLSIENQANCLDPNLSSLTLENNKSTFVNKLKVDIIKIYSKCIDNKYIKDSNIDTLSKILVVFLNSLLIEETNKLCMENFEQEIQEAKDIFKENINNIKIVEAKNTLENFYNNLCNDYNETKNKNFSNIYSAYLYIFS